MKNLNLLFNKSYFDGIEASDFSDRLKERNQQIYGALFSKADYLELEAGISPMEQRFRMKTSYPGLLVGTGYAHEAEKGSNDCIKLGFSFDYVTGQPYVPGSSVKGMLKSCFQPDVVGGVLGEIQENAQDYKIPKEDLLTQNQIATLTNKLEDLKTDIFDGRDVFFDAVLYSGGRINSESLGEKKKGNVMALDYITPHGEATKNPTPLMMVKVLPDVIFEFRFRLSDSIVEGITVSAQQKIALFRTLLELFGVGAKTNVGYGVLTYIADEAAARQRDLAEADAQRALQARATPAPAPSRPAQPQRQSEQTRPAPIVPSAEQGNSAYHPCAVPGCNGRTRFVLCRECQEKARAEGICPLCGKNTGWNRNYNNYFDLCRDCKQKYNPR